MSDDNIIQLVYDELKAHRKESRSHHEKMEKSVNKVSDRVDSLESSRDKVKGTMNAVKWASGSGFMALILWIGSFFKGLL